MSIFVGWKWSIGRDWSERESTPGTRTGLAASQVARTARLFVRLFGALQALLFNIHVGEFVRVEDLAAFQTFHKFGIFFAGEYANAWVFAGFHGYI